MEESLEGSKLHTAEHMFARALQNQGLEIHVRKADTYREDNIGKAYIKEIIPLEEIFKAEKTVNEKIFEDLEVKEQTFSSLKSAIDNNPKLRFNEERLDENMEVRVVIIGDYDFSACKHRHVKRTKEIECFAIKRVSYLGGETEVEFLSGFNALEFLLRVKSHVLSSAAENHFIPEKLAEYLSSLKNAKESSEKGEREMLSIIIENSKSNLITLNGIKLSKFYDEINSILKRKPEKIIALKNEEQIFIIKGRNNDFDLVSLGKKIKDLGFQGVANENIINGRINKEVEEEIEKFFRV